jgi:hypothetical protein
MDASACFNCHEVAGHVAKDCLKKKRNVHWTPPSKTDPKKLATQVQALKADEQEQFTTFLNQEETGFLKEEESN